MLIRTVAIALVLSSCAGVAQPDQSGEFIDPVETVAELPEPPSVPNGPLPSSVTEELDVLFSAIQAEGFDEEALQGVADGGDVRVAWILADMMRFYQRGGSSAQLSRAFETLTGFLPRSEGRPAFVPAFDLLLAWDLAAWDGYDEYKRALYTIVEPAWEPFFSENVSIDWRPVTWGGVLIDDRPLGTKDPCFDGCIPALDDPPTEVAESGTWYADSDIVFGVVVDGEALALPKNQMEVHEMLNIDLGGRRLGIPYCTLCGSAQAYYTDSVPDAYPTAVLRTSGLLTRSNKVMYDLETMSVFDTFTGEALSGPLGRAGVVLDQETVVTSTWGEWKESHPETRILARDGGLGRLYARNPLGDRDANGPIFPVGPVDPRLPVQEPVVGVVAPDGTPLAFPVEAALASLLDGGSIGYGELEVMADGGGLRVSGPDGELPAHQAFWFAWSQFHPTTLVWSPGE